METPRILTKKLSLGSKEKHDKMIEKYSEREFLEAFLKIDKPFQIFIEAPLHIIFDIKKDKYSILSPDLTIITNDSVFVGELKSKTRYDSSASHRRSDKKIGQATAKAQQYIAALKKHQIRSKGFIIVGNEKRII